MAGAGRRGPVSGLTPEVPPSPHTLCRIGRGAACSADWPALTHLAAGAACLLGITGSEMGVGRHHGDGEVAAGGPVYRWMGVPGCPVTKGMGSWRSLCRS